MKRALLAAALVLAGVSALVWIVGGAGGAPARGAGHGLAPERRESSLPASSWPLVETEPPLAAAHAERSAVDSAAARDIVIWKPRPLVCAGVVVDARGNRVARAKVVVEESVAGGGLEVSFEPNGHSIETDAVGSFLIEGASGRELRLVVSHPAAARAVQHECVAGSEALTITLPLGGRVMGRIVTAEPFVRFPLNIRFEPDDGGEPTEITRFGYPVGVGCQALFDLVPVPVGRGTLTVHFGAVEEPLVTIPSILVEPLETAKDTRLDPIDLTGKLIAAQIRAFDPQGVPLEGVSVETLDGTAQGFFSSDTGLEIVGLPPDLDVRIRAPGYRPREFRNVVGETRVTLEPGIPIAVQLQGVDLVPERMDLRLVLERQNEHGGWEQAGSVRLDSRSLDLKTSAAGKHRIGIGYDFNTLGSAAVLAEFQVRDGETPLVHAQVTEEVLAGFIRSSDLFLNEDW